MKIGIVRGVVPRVTQAEYARQFSRFTPVFISGPADRQVARFCARSGLDWRALPLKPVYGVDPVRWILRRQTHQSWVHLQDLASACRNIDVLETHELYFFDSSQAAAVARAKKIPLVVEVWTSLDHHPAYFLPPYSWQVRFILKAANLLVARSRRSEQALQKLGVPSDRLIQLYYGVNLERFTPRRERSDKELRVLFVGRMERFKGVAWLLEIWQRVVAAVPEARLWLVGEGNLLETARLVKGIRILGKFSHHQLPEIYRQVDIFVSPSIDLYWGPIKWTEEFFSHALMEAQASGLPIVASNSGGIAEEIGMFELLPKDKQNWLVEQKNDHQLIKALIEALKDEKRRRLVGTCLRQRAERQYNLKRQVSRLETEIDRRFFNA